MALQREKAKVQQMVEERAIGMGYWMAHQKALPMEHLKGL